MRRLLATTLGWRAGAVAGALLVALGLAGPASAANTNLTATAQYSASSEWESEIGTTTFVAAKAFDGDLTTRWNVNRGDDVGSWLAANWTSPQTVNRVVIREAFDRVRAVHVERFDTAANDWVAVDAAASQQTLARVIDPATNAPTFTFRFGQPLQTSGVRVVFDEGASVSILEVEAWNNPISTLTGTVTDPTGAPIEGVTVRAGTDVALTDAQGKYTLIAEVGQFDVVAGKAGAFRERTARDLELAANATLTRDFVLNPLAPNLALAATAVSSSDWEDGETYNAAKANDGNRSTRWNSRAGDAAGSYLEMQWTQPQTFNQVTIHEAIGRIRNYTLERYDEATAAYVPIVTAGTPPGTGDRTYGQLFATPVTTTRLRLLVNETDEVPSIYEMEVRNAAVGTIRGVVKDAASGAAVANATITTDRGVVLGTTNDKGEFSFLVEADDYVVNVSAEGFFTSAPVTFTINPGQTQEITLTAPAKGTNLALAGTASASTEDEFNPAAQVNDGLLDTYWVASETTDQWVAVTWAQPTRFTVVQLRGFWVGTAASNAIQASRLEVKDQNGNWVALGDPFTPQFLAGRTPDFFFPEGVTTTAVRFFATATHSPNEAPGLAELQVFDAPLQQPAP